MSDRADFPGARYAVRFESLGDGSVADARVVHLEDALNDGSGVGVRLQRAETGAGRRLGPVGMREVGIDEAVAVVRAATEPAPIGGEGEDSGPGAVLNTSSLGFGEATEEAHDEIMGFAVRVDGAADLWHPQLDPVVAEHREDELELGTREGSLRFADDQAAPPALRVGNVGKEPARLGSSGPRE